MKKTKSKKLSLLKSFIILSLVSTALIITFKLTQSEAVINFISESRADNSRYLYVSSLAGSDANNGSASSPFQTIQKAINVAQPGDNIMVEPGNYSGPITIKGLHGTSSMPIRIVGNSVNINSYPVLDGGNPGYTKNTDRPVLTVTNSSWINLERLSFKNSGLSSIYVDNSHYLTIRRNIFDYQKYGVLLRNKSSHLLVEYNEFFQSYDPSSTWTKLKDSKWEGGAYTSFGGAGMSIIRYNYFHNQFNSIFLNRDVRVGNFYDANIWIYRNRFENIVDDPYEPESYAFNNHFFQNTLYNTHRLISLAPEYSGLGPIYVYNNMMVLLRDPTNEASKGRENSAYKLELNQSFFPQNAYLFNNSIYTAGAGTNGSGIDFLSSTVKNLYHFNHAYQTLKSTFSSSKLSLSNSEFSHDMSLNLNYQENPGFPNQDPQFLDPNQEKLTLANNSPAKGKSKAFAAPLGFSTNPVIKTGEDLGAFNEQGSDFKLTPNPVYSVPPGGEDPSFPSNQPWPQDIFGGLNPRHEATWMPGGVPTFTDPSNPEEPIVSLPSPTPTPTPTPTLIPSITPSASPLPSISPNPSPTPPATPTTYSTKKTVQASQDTYVNGARAKKNFGSRTSLVSDRDPHKLIYLKFDLSGMPPNPKRVTLRLYITNAAGSSTTQNVRLANNTWDESSVTYQNRPALSSLLAQIRGGRRNTWITIPLDLSQIPDLSHSLSLAIVNRSTNNLSFASKESTNKPTLIFEY